MDDLVASASGNSFSGTLYATFSLFFTALRVIPLVLEIQRDLDCQQSTDLAALQRLLGSRTRLRRAKRKESRENREGSPS